MSIPSMAFYFFLAIGLICALIGGYLLATLTVQIGQAYTAQLGTDLALLILGILLIMILVWWKKG